MNDENPAHGPTVYFATSGCLFFAKGVAAVGFVRFAGRHAGVALGRGGGRVVSRALWHRRETCGFFIEASTQAAVQSGHSSPMVF